MYGSGDIVDKPVMKASPHRRIRVNYCQREAARVGRRVAPVEGGSLIFTVTIVAVACQLFRHHSIVLKVWTGKGKGPRLTQCFSPPLHAFFLLSHDSSLQKNSVRDHVLHERNFCMVTMQFWQRSRGLCRMLY